MLRKQLENLLLDCEGSQDFTFQIKCSIKGEKINYVIKLKYNSEEHWDPINNFIHLFDYFIGNNN